MAFLRALLIPVIVLSAFPAHGHHMGRSVPIGYTGEGAVHLVAQVVASYFEEQMGRRTELVKAVSAASCIRSLRDREFPMAVLSEGGAANLPGDVVAVGGALGPPAFRAVLVMGDDAQKRLEFSLVPRYMEMLSKGLAPSDWQKAMARVAAGGGVRGAALDMLREADLL